MKEDKEFLCTNMDENDPLIEKYMKEYIKEKCESGQYPNSDELIVNFDITYADGESESFTCGALSEPFGRGKCQDNNCINCEGDGCINIKDDISISKENKACNKVEKNKCEKEEQTCKEHEKKHHHQKKEKIQLDYDNELGYYNEQFYSEEEKWDNCQQEYNEYFKDDSSKKEKKCKCINGDITVISVYSSQLGTRIKGVKINLYKLNGVCPELIDCKITDCEGKVIFMNLPKGTYRVIEVIDKRYFEKPSYARWNEVTIDESNTSDTVYAINNIKECITHR